jgi:hypothetical protein
VDLGCRSSSKHCRLDSIHPSPISRVRYIEEVGKERPAFRYNAQREHKFRLGSGPSGDHTKKLIYVLKNYPCSHTALSRWQSDETTFPKREMSSCNYQPQVAPWLVVVEMKSVGNRRPIIDRVQPGKSRGAAEVVASKDREQARTCTSEE